MSTIEHDGRVGHLGLGGELVRWREVGGECDGGHGEGSGEREEETHGETPKAGEKTIDPQITQKTQIIESDQASLLPPL